MIDFFSKSVCNRRDDVEQAGGYSGINAFTETLHDVSVL